LWSAEINLATGDLQGEAHANISYPIPTEETAAVEFNYVPEEPGPPTTNCKGSVNEPEAKEGFLCVYRGGKGSFGAKEEEDKNVTDKSPGGGANTATEVFFENAFGTKIASQAGASGQLGVDVVFRTLQFNTTASTPQSATTAPSKLVAHGSWAVKPG